MADSGCPWCGEEIEDPFVGGVVEMTSPRFDMALEAHVAECVPYLREQGEML